MDFTDIEGITRDDLNAENKDLRRSIYIECSKTTYKGTLLLWLTKKFEEYFSENLLPFNFGNDILHNFFKEDKIPSELKSPPEDDKPKYVPLRSNNIHNNFFKGDKVPSKSYSSSEDDGPFVFVYVRPGQRSSLRPRRNRDSSSEDDEPEYVVRLGQRSSFRPRRHMRIADLFKRKRPRKKKKKQHWLDEIVYPKKRRPDEFMPYYSPTTSASDLDGRTAEEKLKSEIMEIITSFRKAKFQSTSKQPEDKEDVEVACSSPPSSVLLPSPSLLPVADQFNPLERLRRTVDSDSEDDGDTARVVSQDSSDISDSFFEVRPRRKMSSTSVPVDTEDVCSISQGRKKTKRYQHKSFRIGKVPNTLEASTASGSDLSDYRREAQERKRWDRGHRKPCYAHVKVLIFVNRSVCEELAKYLGLIYIEDIFKEARKNMSKRLRVMRKIDNLKYCPFIQPYINKKRILGYHDICVTNNIYLWHTIYADYKAVIKSDDSDPGPYLEARKDTNVYIDLGRYPHFLEYVEAVTLIINEKLGNSYHTIARYRCKNQRGEDRFCFIRLSLIAIVPFDILDNPDNLIVREWEDEESSDDLGDDSSSNDS